MNFYKVFHINKIWLLYVAEIIFFGLFVLGIIPRHFVIYYSVILFLTYVLLPLEKGVVFFVISIPLFLAIPITESFDNFNFWRVASLILFLKWLYPYYKGALGIRLLGGQAPGTFVWPHFKLGSFSKALVLLFVISALSVFVAPDKILAIKRIIYFINLLLVGFVIYDLSNKNIDFKKTLISFLPAPVILVAVIGVIQLISTYFIDIYQFMYLWGERIQCIQFGNQWCYIAVNVGNTWLAYYGEQLSLRIFSLFPDSHSFPIFLLLGLPAVFAIALQKLDIKEKYRKLIRIRSRLFIVWVPIIFLVVILTGTRGFWAAYVGVILVIIVLLVVMYRKLAENRSVLLFVSSYLIFFLLMFVVAYPIFVSPQFLLSKGDWAMFGSRIKSVIDFGETSNALRIEIWDKTLVSIKNHPLLGVGIGNYPIVLDQDLRLAKAGSSAHNIYLHIAAELGIFAFIVFCYIFWRILKDSYIRLRNSSEMFWAVFYGSSIIFVLWVFGYLMTDVALFDERAFLMFAVVSSLLIKKSA